jgi:acyl carrier protein
MKGQPLEDVKAKVKEIISNDLDVNIAIEDIDDTVPLYDEGLGLDSIAIINFIVLVEKRFDINFSESEISSQLFSNVSNLSQFIHAKINAA